MVDGAIKHLPLTGADLFGRDDELSWLEASWRDGVFVASIVAWGGVGKTSLVAKWLAKMRDDGWRGAERVYDWSFYQQGTTSGSSDTFFAETLAKFGDPDPTRGSPWDKGERLAKLVREKRTLLVLDGVEPLQYGPGEQEGQFKDPALQTLVKELASNNNGFLLITSRLRLRDLDGLSGAKVQTKDLDRLSADAGAALLRARGAKGTEEELREAADEYKGHALALTLLGSYLEDVADCDVRRRNEIGPLVYDERNGGHARRVMQAYEPWLEPAGRSILRMLGLFDRPASEDEIAALRAEPLVPGLNETLAGVGGRDWNKAIAKLKRIHLIAAETRNAIDAHPLVRQHFSEQLKRDHLDAWREGHRRLYEFLRTNTKELPETIAEMEPLYKSVAHGCLAGKNQEVLEDVWLDRIQRGSMHFNTQKLGAFGNEAAMLSAFFDPPWERVGAGLNELEQVFVLGQAGMALRALSRLREATEVVRRGLEKCIGQQRWEDAAMCANNLSELLQSQGELREALEMAEQCVDWAYKSADAFQERTLPTTLAAAQHAVGRRKDAEGWFQAAEWEQQAQQVAYPQLYSIYGFRYCDLLLDQGRDIEVRERAAQLLEWDKTSGRFLDIGLDHLSLGRAHLAGVQRETGGGLEESAYHHKQAVERLRRTGYQEFLPLGLLARAALHVHTRAFADARRDLHEAMTIATRCGFRLHEADAHLGYTRLAIAERNATAARDHLEKARELVEETGYHRRDGEIADLQREIDKLPAHIAPIAISDKPVLSPSRPMTSQTSTQQDPVDIGIVIALEEEFTEFAELAGALNQHRDELLTAYRLQRGPYRLVATFVGDMGESHATRVTERMISIYHPHSIVVVGIAAGVHDDLRVGDVYVPAQAVQYMQDSKAVANKDNPNGFDIKPGAPAYRADFALLEAVRHLAFGHADLHRRFVEDSAKDLELLIPDKSVRHELFNQNLVRPEVKRLADAHVATGPVVGTAPGFSAWIRGHDRNIKALEMESAAVWLAAQSRDNPVRALAIRGISDYGDERKKALDDLGGGALRKYAMRNAVRFLFALLDAKTLPNPL